MGQNELLITELILCNMLNDLEPAEIAALLSGLVFQAKIQGEPVIPEKLNKVNFFNFCHSEMIVIHLCIYISI